MHEMSVAAALLEAVEHETSRYPQAQVLTVYVQVGRLRQIEPLALEFCYQTGVRGTRLEGSEIDIETIGASAACDSCRTEFAVEDEWFECPSCHGLETRLLTGKELTLSSIDLEETLPSEDGALE